MEDDAADDMEKSEVVLDVDDDDDDDAVLPRVFMLFTPILFEIEKNALFDEWNDVNEECWYCSSFVKKQTFFVVG